MPPKKNAAQCVQPVRFALAASVNGSNVSRHSDVFNERGGGQNVGNRDRVRNTCRGGCLVHEVNVSVTYG